MPRRVRWLSLLLLALPLLVSSPARAGEDPAAIGKVHARYLRLTMAGQHAGGIGLRVGRFENGQTFVRYHVHVEMTRNAGESDHFVTDTRSREVYDEGGNLVASQDVDTEAGVVMKTFVLYGADRVLVRYEGPGGTYTSRIAIPADHDTDYRVFRALRDAWHEGETGHRAYQSLSAKDRVFQPCEMWLLGRATFEHDGTTYPAWKVRQKEEGVTIEGLVDDEFLPYEQKMAGGLMTATWVDEPPFEVEGGGWSLSALIPVDRAVPRQLDLEELDLRVRMAPRGDGDADADAEPLFVDCPYQTVAREEGGYRLVLHARRPPKGFAPVPFPVETEDAQVRHFLEPTPQSQSDNPKVRERARKIVEGATDSLDAAGRLVRWVWAHVAKRSGVRGNATAVEVLQSMEGDCSEHAALVVALARAVGIPARAVEGIEYVAVSKEKAITGYHEWAEVWVGRWVPVDATIPQVGTSARYVFLGIDEPGEEGNAGRMITAMTHQMHVQVLGWKHFGQDRVEADAAKAGR